jgi:2-C-methyl-D-erythritol 4-phosphate cytidylyltransferase
MTTALIFAGGTGVRMNSGARPKQFLELHGKPIIIYTIERFEVHPRVDNIVIVCLESWIHELKRLLRRYAFEKISQIVPGGREGCDSIHNGLRALSGVCGRDDVILIHDGVRPFINEGLISANIDKVEECGNAITVEAVTESVVRMDVTGRIKEVPPRTEMHVAKAPQSFRFGLIADLYRRAHDEGVGTVDSAHLCSLYGVEMHTVRSNANNVKITTPTDYYIFRALYEAMENEQIFGIG